ncbi:hypothetical protein DMA15_33525 [Streptomyces sp. WAC 01529]|uniref:hypothetical protein n=1 Tax=Streptomyces sp. WAC 01529 TaxID=2203205 RepID=UPI000F6D42A8|nr:hypothetical protein [Streptomyces sp. WAC 01529]AZM56891.1 hypothetical protein DMA15_33525 [Streptomyces sp. WAC 01529]
MHTTRVKSHTTRAKYAASLSGIATVAVLLGPAAGMTSAADDSSLPTLTARTSVSSVRAAQEFRVSGESRNMPPATPVSLQQQQGTRWVDLPASVRTTPRGTYSMRVVLGIEGRNALRVTGGGAVSPAVHVMVQPREQGLP